MEIEEWKWIEGFEGKYEISSFGRVRSHTFSTPIILSPHTNNRGYTIVTLSGKPRQRRVHRLVAQAFLPNPNNYPIVHHKDADRSNPRLSNLEWTTASQNTLYAYQSGRLVSPMLKKQGEEAPAAKLTANQVLAIRREFDLGCVTKTLLACKYNVSLHAISDIINRNSWRYI